MYSHDPYQHQPSYPAQPHQDTGRWVTVLWVVVPAILVILCCAGCVVSGVAGAFMDGFEEGYSSSS
ncbi:hypothetical protein [Micromonospora sp. WMMD980]|uniref:hypothetical protein n=1 Tax=Micromonospora sp. WMMD980 TaxID=3016088 RepID=UPI002417F51C|nr:hypothetical protein [Micromonospora sp. WMMD980]MDG4802660.1 hypothetical protein [Micromonospora sp. WMMD980]